MWETLASECRDIYRYRYVALAYIETNLKLRYRRSVLGFIWTVLAPMLHYLVMGVVFSVLMRDRMPNYFVFYFSGAVFFSIVSATLGRAPSIFFANENYIKKIYVPKMLFVLNGTLYEGVNFLLSSTALIILGVLTGDLILSPYIFLSLIAVVLVLFFLIGLGSMISVASVYFRDLMHIVPIVLQAVFFVTPVIYNETMLPERFRPFIKLNPIYYYLELFRLPLLSQQVPGIDIYLKAFGLSFVFFVLGFWIIKKFDNKIVFKL